MAQISGVPLPVLPHSLGQIAVRSGALPDLSLRAGQNLTLTVLKSAAANTSTQVQIAGQTLTAILPTAVSAGDKLQIVVGKAADGQARMQLAGQKSAPTLNLPTGKAGAELQGALRAGGGQVLVQTKLSSEGTQITIGGRSFQPSQLGVTAAMLPSGAWAARLSTAGGMLALVPYTGADAQLRSAAGQMILKADAISAQAAIGLAAQADEESGAYAADGAIEDTDAGIPWLTMPGGQAAAIEMRSETVKDELLSSAKLELWGNKLGPVQMILNRSPAGISINVSVEADKVQELQSQSAELSARLRAITGKPAIVNVRAGLERPLHPAGFDLYG
jgi:hypothetical protein